MTVEWYKTYYQGNEDSMYDFSMQQIKEYVEFAKSRDITWSDND